MNKSAENSNRRSASNRAPTPLVSVIIPAYNHECWIVETLDSVFDQSMADFEVIVVDDGSQDQTVQAISLFKDSRLRLIVQENRGTAAAINRGLSFSQGKYIAILNSNDLFMTERLAVMVDSLETRPECMMAFSGVRLIDEKGVVLAPERSECSWRHDAQADYHKDGDLLLSLLRDNFLCTSSNFFFRRRLLFAIGHFRDLRYVNDLDFLVRALSRYEACYCEAELLAYRQHAGNTLKERELEKGADFLLEVSLVLAAALADGRLVRQWGFSTLVGLLAKYYRLHLETLLFSVFYFYRHQNGFQGVKDISPKEFEVLLSSGRRRLEEQDFVEKLSLQAKDQHQYIGTLQEAQRFYLEQMGSLEKLSKTLQEQNLGFLQQMRQRDQELARMEQFQHQIWQNREWYRQQYEAVINAKRFRLFTILSELRHGHQVVYQLRELLRIFLPSSLKEKLRRWRAKATLLKTKCNLLPTLKRKMADSAGRFFNAHHYHQESYGGAPLLTLLVACDLKVGMPTALLVSLKTQTWSQFDVIFMDRSGDPLLKQKFADEMGKEGLSSWKVLPIDTSFRVEIFNRALNKAQGKYIVALYSGDEVAPTFLEKSLLLLEASPPHFFIKSVNPLFGAQAQEGLETVDPVASFHENRFRAVVFRRSAGLELLGYNKTLPAGYEEWEFYVNLVRHGQVGVSLSDRIYHCHSCGSELTESNEVSWALAKEHIQALHLGYIVNHERYLRRRARQYWQVSESLCNLMPSSGYAKKDALWLDLVGVSFEPWRLFPKLLARFKDSDLPLIVTVDKRWQTFFNYNKKVGLQVYFPEQYYLQGKRDDFYCYLQASYKLQKVCVGDCLQWPESELNAERKPGLGDHNGKLRILYVAPWLITGGADTMTVDWFCQLKSEWSDKYFVTTLFRENNNWLPKIADYAQEIYDLPALGCRDQAAMTEFMLEFIALKNIDVLHIMNSEVAFHALPKLKERFPGLKVVAQFHCFDYFPDGRRTGYAFDMPPRYDHFIDRYNLEYAQLGKEIMELYPYVESSKFKVIHGRIDSDFYNPEGRQTSVKISDYRRKDALNILFIGRLDRQKQPLRLLKIATVLRGQGVPFAMHIIGEGNLESQKKEFLAELQDQGLREQVFWYGEQSLDTLPDWYMIADILLLTSDWEGVPMVLYQAMAMAVVPVVAEVGGCAELVNQDCGFLVSEPEKFQAYVVAIQELLDDKRRQKMGSAARQRMLEHFSLAGLDQEYKSFYEDLIGIK